MDPLERQLKRALEREDPPEGFAERVLERAREKPRAAPAGGFFRPFWRLALAGGLAGAMLFGGVLAYRQRQERLRGEAARAELMLALQIASSELNRVRQVVIEHARGQTNQR